MDGAKLTTLFEYNVYGSLLNSGCKFFDKRIGQSTTLTGRQIVKHMSSEVNRIITGKKDHTGSSIIYGDTDSVVFSAYPEFKKLIDSGKLTWTKDSVVELYNEISREVNESFPQFMSDAFNCPLERGSVIKAARELIGTKGLFITKKRYALMYYDKKNSRTDVNGKPGKIKAMGLDLKRSDTPDFMQDFLSKILEKVLLGFGESDIIEMVKSFREEFKQRPGWEKGTPKRVNNITKFREQEEELGKANMPGHVRASINWNTLKKIFNDNHSLSIMDGAKTIICKLKPNALNFTSVAYPIDQLVLPEWFKELPFDDAEMENTIINAKIENLIGVLDWDLSKINEKNTVNKFFTFS